MAEHTLADCPHNPTFEHIAQTLNRLDAHTLRQAVAMEEIARQGVTINNHEMRIVKNTKDISSAWAAIREIETRHATEDGKEEVIEEQQKFWAGVKQQFTGPAIVGLFFILWLADKFNIPVALAKLWKEMRG